MSRSPRVKLLCSFGGEFAKDQGRLLYLGGKTRLISIDRSSSFRSILSKMSEVCGSDPRSIEVKFQLLDGSLDSRLVSVESDDDVRNMIDEFDEDRKIPIFLFTDGGKNGDGDDDVDDDDEQDEDSLPALDSITMDCMREAAMLDGQEPFSSQSGPTNFATSLRRDYAQNQVAGPSMLGGMFQRDSQSLVVGQEYEDVQTFRNALTSAAIAANFELHMIRSDQRRVTARCASQGCTWRVHASKRPQVNTFRIRTLTSEHTCLRSQDAGHRQATAKWIANCIREKLRQNRNYKPREILNDIHREYGVLITYKRAFLGREKALEELQTERSRDTVTLENDFEHFSGNSMEGWGEIHDPPRKKLRAPRENHTKDARPLYCTRCNQIGHNRRRTCGVIALLKGGSI